MALALFINNFLIVNATVVSGSMETTVMTGSRVFCNRLAYASKDPARYDIITFTILYHGEEQLFFKRIIGLPGETVKIIDGKVYIDGAEEPLYDGFVRETPRGNFGPFEVPPNHYFVLGDNRNSSDDSKGWDDPYVSREQIRGKAIFCYYPEFKWMKNPEGEM